MNPISSILVANRGEIAARVMRTAKSLGLRTVAVYSDADANAYHVREADTAVRIGPAPVSESYLRADAILEAAQLTGADAIHPGYGFLSENQAFAAACETAGIIFIGPPNQAIDVMGDKARAKRAMLEAGVPCIPGYQGDDQSVSTLVAEAEKVGLPVMVKAAAGGGGRGMRLVNDIAQLEAAIGLAQSESLNAFGSSELIIEKAVVRPRHVEIQVFADQHGNTLHLGERDCSIQRRHQKVVEESPCPVMTPELRRAMGEAAVEAARAVNYVGAGTVEFLLDADGSFYFLEMNTRLQVEHPVTELVTGFDLVEWQIRVARNEPLPVVQDDIELRGYAIEIRLYAEEPEAGFLPSTGPVELFSVPRRKGLRVDAGVATGDEVTPFYDAMVAKIIGYGETREDARVRLLASLRESALLGLSNNRDFLIDVLDQQTFVEGKATTAFIGDLYGESFSAPAVTEADLAAASVILHELGRREALARHPGIATELLDWSSVGELTSHRHLVVGDQEYAVELRAQGAGCYAVKVANAALAVRLQSIGESSADLIIQGSGLQYAFKAAGSASLSMASSHLSFSVRDVSRLPPEAEDAGGVGTVTSPMHGVVLSIDVALGELVVKGQRLAVLEAMKMQHEITAGVDGSVVEIAAEADCQLAAGDLILVVEESE